MLKEKLIKSLLQKIKPRTVLLLQLICKTRQKKYCLGYTFFLKIKSFGQRQSIVTDTIHLHLDSFMNQEFQMFASCEVNEGVCWWRKDKIYSLVLQRILCHLSSWSSCHHPHHPHLGLLVIINILIISLHCVVLLPVRGCPGCAN